MKYIKSLLSMHRGRLESRRIISSVCVILLLTILFFVQDFKTVEAAGENHSRVINLVYDDSGSMIYTHDKKVDTWCKAKYAVEVFAAMLTEGDTMNIYVMSDFDKRGKSSHKKIKTLSGANAANDNVKKVHDMVTDAGDTPFDSVRTALDELKKEEADEKWLVVLTDGEFEDGALSREEMDKTFASKPQDISVMFLGMGPDAGAITVNENDNIFYEKAKDNNEILTKLTGIGQQVFNRDKLKVKGDKNISFDVPMDELVVFAQGSKVAINGVKNKNGKSAKADSSVIVTYSTKASLTGEQYDNPLIDKNLRGTVAVFKGPFPAGTYTLDVDGAKTTDVYYSPNVAIALDLKESKSGKKVTKVEDLEAGDYEVDFALIDKKTKKKLPKSELLGEITYEAKVTNNGETHDKTYVSGDKISIEEGPLSIDATGHYLRYHTVETHMEKAIYANKKIDFSLEDDPGHAVTSKGFDNNKPVKVKATINEEQFTDEQWESMGKPKITPLKDENAEMMSYSIKKSNSPGIYEITPILPKELGGKTYGDVDLKLSYDGKSGKAQWKGAGNIHMSIDDERSWFTRNRDLIVKCLAGLLFLILLLGFLLKRCLPKRLKANPTITKVPLAVGYSGGTDKGKVQKSPRWIPFVPQTGTIRFLPKSVKGIPRLKVKAVGGNKMEITNISSYADKENITFNGNPIEKDQKKPLRTGAGLTIEVTMAGCRYTCTLNN